MTDNNIVLPVITHLFTAVVLIFFWKRTRINRIISVVANSILVISSFLLFTRTWNAGVFTMQAGNWPAPFGITFVADVFSSTMVLLTSLSGMAVSMYSAVGVSKARMKFGYFPMLHFLLMGLNGAFLTGDIFNLYVWFEIIIISSFVLMTLGGRKPQIEGGIKYVAANLMASVIFLTGIAILYGLTGSLNMADLSRKVALVPNRHLINITALLFLVGFGIKSAVFPLFLWLPSSYHTPPSAIAAIFGGLLTKVGVYALLRVFTLIFVPDDFIAFTLMTVATATLLTGAFGAIIQKDIRRILSYLIVCHVGYMIAGLGLFSEIALTGSLFYLFHDIMVKTNLFLVSGLIYKIKGTIKLEQAGSLYAAYPKLSLLMALVLFSMVGVPPLSGFWPKIYLFQAAFAAQSYIVIGAIIVASFFTLYITAKLWAEVFWKDAPTGVARHNDLYNRMNHYGKALLVTPVVLLAIVTLYIGLGAENIAKVSVHIAQELMDPSPYINAVLGEIVLEP
jgi:multicomponent Na+:H+ antiporter subunit D